MSGFLQVSATCKFRREMCIERRPGNALNVEIGTPMPRCMLKPPDGRGVTKDGGTLDWLRSGGKEMDYGVCCAVGCPEC